MDNIGKLKYGEMRKTSNGFTVVEFLIIIAILGMVALAILPSLNPVEQVYRTKDIDNVQSANHILSAIAEFYQTYGYFPWQSGKIDTASTGFTKIATRNDPPNGWTVGNGVYIPLTNQPTLGNDVLSVLETSIQSNNKIDTEFVNRITASNNPLYVFNRGGLGETTYICFRPKSNFYLQQAIVRCQAPPADYPTAINTKSTINQACQATPHTMFCLPKEFE